MGHYFRLIDMPGKQLAKRCGVSHSQVYMARKRNVGADNAEKISWGVAGILGIPEEERLRLKAEIMGHPGELVRAYFGDARRAGHLLGVDERAAAEILDEERSVTHTSGKWALKRLRELGAPGYVIGSVDRRLMPPPEPRRGLVTYTEHGAGLVERRRETREGLERTKPKIHEAIRDSGLKLTEIYGRAGVGKETLRRALYGDCVGQRSARSIAAVLREACGLSDADAEAVEEELKKAPRKDF